MMCRHEFGDPTTEVHHRDEEEKYRHHECATMIASPLSEERLISMEILGLEDRESSDDDDEDEGEEARFRYTENHIWSVTDHSIRLRESFLEHIKCREEDDEESYPLDARIFLEHLRDPTWCDDHEDDRNHETDHEVRDISMTRSSDGENIIEGHSDISDDDRFDSCWERTRVSTSLFVMFTRTDLTVELPYHIEEQDRTEELESRNLEEKYDSEGEDDTQNRRTCDSPEDCFFLELWREFLCCHPDEDRIVPTHDEIDEDDIEEGECSCCGEEVCEVALELWYKFEHREEG